MDLTKEQQAVHDLVATDPALFVAYVIEGEFPFDPAGKLLCALTMANRARLWGHKVEDVRREWFGWKQVREPDEWSRNLGRWVTDGTLDHLLFCFSIPDVEEALPRLGYSPGPADVEYNAAGGKFGLRLYKTAEQWKTGGVK